MTNEWIEELGLIDVDLDEVGGDDFSDLENQGEISSDGLYEHFRFVSDKGQKMTRIDKYLVDRMVGTSRNRIQNAADAGYIFVNGKPVKSNYKVKPHDVVSIMLNRPRQETLIIPEDIPLDIVFEDDDLMVVNKPPGIVVHPGHGNWQGTLLNAIAFHMKDHADYNADDPSVGLVHRIDKDTSGLLVIAKTPHAKAHLGKQFFNKTTKRKYVAIVWGSVENEQGRIEGNLGRSPKDRLQMTVFPDGEMGKHAVTHYEVIERLGYVSVVQCVLETGRTHQIRVHMKHIGHTLFNDTRYGGHEILKGTTFAKYKQFVNNCFAICPRQALHAKTLGFIHPRTGEELFFEAPVPNDIVQLIARWREYIANREI